MRDDGLVQDPDEPGRIRLVVDGQFLKSTSGWMDENGSAVLTFWEAAAPNCASIAMKDLFFCETVKVVLPGAKKDLLNWEFASAEFEPGASINVGPRPVVFLIEYDLEFWAQPYSIADRKSKRLNSSHLGI